MIGGSRADQCRRGHEFTPENTYVSPNGKRECRMCGRERRRRRYSIANREKRREYQRQYHLANLERERERSRRYYVAHQERERERKRRYWAAHSERRTWNGMLHRCTNPNNASYHNYGGRGIEVRYESYEQFLADVGPRPGPEYSIDRIDVNGHYDKGNVRWATASEQAKNRRPRVLSVAA